MHDQENELDDALYQALKKRCAAGDAAVERNDFASAIRSFQQAFALLPEPYEDWEASTWVLFSLGEAQFFNEQYAAARESLAAAMHCPGAIGNPLMHLRLGQVQYELANYEKAKDELLRAYMNAGEEIFVSEEKKYFHFLQKEVRL